MNAEKMKFRNIRQFKLSAVGYGAMGLSHGYGACPEHKESIRLLKKAYECGCNFFDTAEAYGCGENERLVGEAFDGMRDKVIIATKLHLVGESNDWPKYIEEHLDASLKNLRTNYVDIYYMHRLPDPKKMSLEDMAKVFGELIKKGKIKGWGISQATSEEIERCNAVTPLTCVQNEYSMMERMYEKEIKTCEKLGISFVAFSPMAAGFLSGKYNKDSKYEGDDVRRVITRFKTDNVVANQPLLDMLKNFADKKGATMAQISLAWMLKKSPIIIPIPGMRTDARIEENLSSVNVELTDDEYNQIENELSKIVIYGDRSDKDIIEGLDSLKKLAINYKK
jgi:aryl-alcohol dehydrogenase-like predicted oxidoreductase